MAASILLCTTDFFTTSIAIGMGLSEGNYALIALSQGLGLGLLATLGLMKAFFILGCFATSFIGIRMRGCATSSLAIAVLGVFVLLQLVASVNNLSILIG